MKIDVQKLTTTKKTALGIPGPSFPSLQSIHSPHQPIPVIPPIPLILPIPSIPFNPISTTLYHNTLSVFGSGWDCERIWGIRRIGGIGWIERIEGGWRDWGDWGDGIPVHVRSYFGSIRTLTYAYKYTYTHTYTFTHDHTHTYTYTYPHTITGLTGSWFDPNFNQRQVAEITHRMQCISLNVCMHTKNFMKNHEMVT